MPMTLEVLFMPVSLSSLPVLLMLLVGGMAVAQSPTSAGTTPGAQRVIELTRNTPSEVPEVRIGAGRVTTWVLGAPLKLARVELEARELFSRVEMMDDLLMLIPSPRLDAGRALRLRLHFMEGTHPASADFLLRMDLARGEHQVNVNPQREAGSSACGQEVEVERAKTHQCQTELEQVRQRPEGLTGLLARMQLDEEGVTVHQVRLTGRSTQRPGDPLSPRGGALYLASRVVAVDLEVKNLTARPWVVAGADLVGQDGARLKVLRVWSPKPIPPGEQGRVVVEAEAGRDEVRERFTVSVWQEGEPPTRVLDDVAFR